MLGLPKLIATFERRCAVATLCVVGVAVALAGCGAPKTGPVAAEQTSLGWLGTMYGMYIGQHGGQTPKSIDDLRKFVDKTMKPEMLTRLNVQNIDALFVSPRDGKPYVLVSYAKLPPPTGGQPAPLVLYEAEGQGGQHAAAFLGGNTRQVSDQELQQLLPTQSKPAGK